MTLQEISNVTKSPKFYTKDGWLTPYALACGYMEINQGWEKMRLACMERDSACFHVKGYDVNGYRDYWESFLTLKEARQDYLKQLEARNAQRTINK